MTSLKNIKVIFFQFSFYFFNIFAIFRFNDVKIGCRVPLIFNEPNLPQEKKVIFKREEEETRKVSKEFQSVFILMFIVALT